MSFTSRQKNNKVKKLLIYSILILVLSIIAFVFLSPSFEKNAPKVVLKNNSYWNLKESLTLELIDDTKIKSYDITYNDGINTKKLETKLVSENEGKIVLDILAPKFNRFEKVPEKIILNIQVVDTSKWNFFNGNETRKEISLTIDRKKPIANVINNSYLIRQGGSATVVVEVKDENLDDFYISFNSQERFELIPFYKKNFYAAIIAWPVDINDFDRVNLVAIDKANNITVTKVPYYIKSMKKQVDKIKISDSFVNKVSKNVLERSGLEIPSTNEQIFISTNKDLRNSNVSTIKEVTKKSIDYSLMVDNFDINVFRQLRGSKNFANYGERRHYYYNGNKVDEAWHLGMDWASVKNANVYASNSGKVIFKDYLGIYGNTAIIYHGFGLSSLYAHASKFNIELYDNIKPKQLIANTGSTGAVFGDHLHFGIIVQGLEVNPLEWMDKKWIDTNVTKILSQAKKVIDTK